MNYYSRRFRERLRLVIINIFFVITITYFCVYLLAIPKTETIIYPLTSEPIANPLMGWAPWATIDESTQPHSLVYADLTWREFEPQEGLFDFAFFEEENQIPRWLDEGKRVVFRFVLDKPGASEHLDIPDWLYKKIGGDGDFYYSTYGGGFSPNYSNPVLIEYHQRAIDALGKQYGENNSFVYIELGSLGHWGEWHVDLKAGIRPLPNESVRDSYVHHYIDAFPNIHLLMRRPFTIAAQSKLGLYNDMTAKYSATTTWLDWINNGGEFSQTGESNGLKPMPDGWKSAPIGGEQATSLRVPEIYGQNIDQTIQLLKMSHTTFIGPGGPNGQESADEYKDQIDLVLSTLGYRLYIDKFQMPPLIRYCNSMDGKIFFGNNGIAPIYYNWPVLFYVFGENKMPIFTYPVDIDLRKVFPGRIYEIAFSLPLDSLGSGVYRLGLAIVDPKNNQPVVKFAMKNLRSDLIFDLGKFELVRDDMGRLISQIPGICSKKWSQ